MDRKRRLMENNNGWPLRSQLFDGAPFRLPLLNTAVPASAASGTTATFTRATTKTWQNNDGYLVTGLAGEIGFPGARRVRNLLTFTEDFSNAAWTKLSGGTGTVPVLTSGFTDPNGGATAWRLQADRGGAGGANYSIIRHGFAGGGQCRSIYIKSNTGSSQVVYFGAPASGQGQAVTATTSWQRLSPTNYSNVNFDIGTYGAIAESTQQSIDVLIWHPQLEDVTAQTTQTAGEYVSVGVTSAPYYHGSFADGVRAFPNDLSGNPIPSTTLLGYSAEGARTNYALWNRDLTNVAWTKTSCTAALTATGADNAANSASTLTATAGNATCLQSITRVSAQRVTGCKIKRRTGTGTINMTQDNGVTWTPVTVTSAYTNVAIPAATAANPIIGFQIVTNGDAIDVDFVMHEEAAFVSSSIATTTIAVARNADVLTYSSAGNILDAAGWCYAEYSSPAMTLLNAMAVVGDGGGTNRGPLLTRTITSGAHMFDGTNLNAGSAGTPANNVMLTAASTWGGGVATVGVDGVLGAQGSYDGSYGLTSLGIGYGAVNMFGTIRDVRIGQRQLSSSELQSIIA